MRIEMILNVMCRKRGEVETQDPAAARKVQKADREKLRRDRLNEHFLDLGSTLGLSSIHSNQLPDSCFLMCTII